MTDTFTVGGDPGAVARVVDLLHAALVVGDDTRTRQLAHAIPPDEVHECVGMLARTVAALVLDAHHGDRQSAADSITIAAHCASLDDEGLDNPWE